MSYQSPYTRTPGSSTPGPGVAPAVGKSELWGFFWLTLLNTAIIAAVGVGTWWYVH